MPEEPAKQPVAEDVVDIPPPPPPPSPPNPADEIAQLKARLEQLAHQQQQQPVPPSSHPPPGTPDPAKLEEEFWKNPLGMSAAIAQRAAQEAAQGMLAQLGDTLFLTAREQARRQCKSPELFDRYATEIDAKMAQLHPQFRLRADIWLNAAMATFGEHIHEIREMPEPKAPAVKVKGPSPPSPLPAPASKETPLTDEERWVCKRLGITEEQYRKGKQWAASQSPTGPSSWDEVVTFDTYEKRRRERAK